ncbi:MAG: XRE family transcriptional regulator [Brevundimonas sp.]|nr:XRE family transcriptional regulator [Brevundimonas sp.]
MASGSLISNDRLAREAEATIAELDAALSSDHVLRSILAGMPSEVIEGVRRSLRTEHRELSDRLDAYRRGKSGEFDALKQQAGNDPGAFLIAARLIRGLSQKDLARKLGLREQAIQRWEAERYRSINLANYQKVAQTLGVRWKLEESAPVAEQWGLAYDVSRDDLAKVVRHARAQGWLAPDENSDENSIAALVRRVGDHVVRYGTPSLLRTGLRKNDRPDNWSLLAWKAQVTRRAEAIIASRRPRYKAIDVAWLLDLVRLSQLDDGPAQAQRMLLEHGIVLVVEPQIPGMSLDGAAFLIDDIPVIGLTLLRDALDNFWFTLLHEIAHIILHYRTGLSAGFFDDLSENDADEFEVEANRFAQELLIPEETWVRSPARISKSADTVERLASQLKIHPAIVFGRIRMERNDYKIFSDRIGRGLVRTQFLPPIGKPQ